MSLVIPLPLPIPSRTPLSIPILDPTPLTKVRVLHDSDVPRAREARIRETKGKTVKARGLPGGWLGYGVELGGDGGAGGAEEEGWVVAAEGDGEDVDAHGPWCK